MELTLSVAEAIEFQQGLLNVRIRNLIYRGKRHENNAARDAVELLNKWHTESTGVLVIFADRAVSLHGSGYITSLSDDVVFVERVPHFHIKINLSRLEKLGSFEYSDIREEPQEVREEYSHLVDQRLRLHCPLGTDIQIYTLKEQG